MYKLNLPDFNYTLREADGKVWIFDGIRKKYMVLTPEEWVRQHFIHFLVTEMKYPRTLIRVEGGLKYNQLRKRSDIVVFDRHGKPWMIIECKSPEVAVSEEMIRQVSAYNHTLQAAFVGLTNGLKHYCAEIDWRTRSARTLKNFPGFQEN